MDIPFIYYKHVTGKNFIGRGIDVNILSNLLSQSENIVIYEPPKEGKNSLIQQAFLSMRIRKMQFSTAEYSLLNVRTIADLMMNLGTAVLRGTGHSPAEYAASVEHFLPGSHFIFDPEMYARKQAILSLNWDIDDEDIKAILTLPYRVAAEQGHKMYVVLNEFQNVMLTEDGELVCSIFEKLLKEMDPELKKNAAYLFVGSEVNAMKEIFDVKRFFWRQVERVRLSTIDTKDIIDYIVKGYLAEGKVLDRDLMLGVCKLFRNNIWYINHFAAICDSFSKGYIMEPILIESLETLISVHEPRFKAIMNDLTTFQICLLRAILDGHTKFSSAEVIQHYNLNSSANVRRLKDALCKKEIVTFGENDEPIILDPLFEYWVSKYFFRIKTE